MYPDIQTHTTVTMSSEAEDDGKLQTDDEPEPEPDPQPDDDPPPPVPKLKPAAAKELQRQLALMKKEHAKARKAMKQKFASKEAEVRDLAARNRELETREKRQATPIRNPFPPKRLCG